ncbi:unnamed protein product [Owenia fusiformis]|uniref:Laminin subunit beta-1 n=1 Tax=Owenia fusiformis TaxID=6347 RepID=A0A8S4NQQ9_OWEFU|nr:unnamed protein product [Owenia fusiformis]
MIYQALVVVALLQGAMSQRSHDPCVQSSCYPATGDLLIGRENRLYASSTCGEERRSRFCIVSHLEDRKKCFICDSRNNTRSQKLSHRVQNIVSNFDPNHKPYSRWWQAENGKKDVYIQLNLEAEFHFTHLVMTFKTFRPKALVIERSFDFGKTWRVYRYYAHDCSKSFPGIPTGPLQDIDDVICESRYSAVAPSSRGEVVFRVLPPSLEIKDPYTQKVQNLLKLTNLRVNFTELHTLGDQNLDRRPEIKEKYYYAMYDMIVRGSCSCYGHASRCVPIPGAENSPDMVHGRCQCTHNTKGLNCAECEDFYNDKPWKPAFRKTINACERCQCNDHATRCHFDPAVYEANGQQSGGVCDNCQHNTMGRQCQECKPFFYQVPGRALNDPYICEPCDCDRFGSEHSGECEGRTDQEDGLVAGRCICKRYVTGIRCDTCLDGYWNLLEENPDGCEACTCNTLGTVGNYGCDKVTGVCTCKRFVTGRSCDTCLPGYYGLSNEREGCKACDCDVGGSLSNDCDQRTGECQCRENIIGRRCDQSRPGFFIPDLDWMKYEGEFATGTERTRVVIRELIPGRIRTWTGPGFMRVHEGDSLTFKVDDIVASGEYDIIIRYEPQMPERWEDVRVTVIRPELPDQRGVCANSIPQDDLKATTLPPGSRHYVVTPPSCLESGVSYTIRLDFNRYKSDRTTPDASILIDSIALMPNVDSIPIFQGPGLPEDLKIKFIRDQCREKQESMIRGELPESCKKLIFSIGAVTHQRALPCECDVTGSHSAECAPLGGDCQCKSNVIGRRCDQCAPGTYGFGPRGCSACDCDGRGSRDNFCEVTTGQCLCIPKIKGRQCNKCLPGFWNFPNCQPCECNGHAPECADGTGGCLRCADNTAGPNCGVCAPGFYGDPRVGVGIACKECMCPGGANSGMQHADTCQLDRVTQNVRCNCKPGYVGANCDECAENYYGNPRQRGGTCQKCTCSGNIDSRVPGSCDKRTGECLKCLGNTEGFNCQYCKPGYYGDATKQECRKCICNPLGTDQSAGPCDSNTGKCPCLPNVVGQSCDQCAPNYWKIASGEGCEACNCDLTGSFRSQCNQFTGQCDCEEGRGGRTCSDCEQNMWGDPSTGCYPCKCNASGSATLQCDRRTGLCDCLEGVAGDRCDRCDRGTTGTLPNCVPCGECFENWDRIINELRTETNTLIDEAADIKREGAPGAFEKEFEDMENKLDQVRDIVENANITSGDITDLKEKLRAIRTNLTENDNAIDDVKIDLDDTNQRVTTVDNKLANIKRKVEDLKKAAEELEKNATDILLGDVEGAFNNITKKAQEDSRKAQMKVDQTEYTVIDSSNVRQQVDEILADNQDEFDRKIEENDKKLDDIDSKVNDLDAGITDLNEMVCDKRGEPCDELCGGAGCGKCGGLSCDEGAVSKAEGALDYAKDGNVSLSDKKEKSDTLLNSVRDAKADADDAKDAAQMAYDRAYMAMNQSTTMRDMLLDLLQKIRDFLSQQRATPEEVRTYCEQVLDLVISLKPEEIRNLSRQINETITGLTDIDAILDATRDDLLKAKNLKERADKAKENADAIRDTANEILELLKQAREAQDIATEAIDAANEDIDNAEKDLTSIESETSAGLDKSTRAYEDIEDLKARLEKLKTKYLENENDVKKAKRQAEVAQKLADEAEDAAENLTDNYGKVKEELTKKYEETTMAKGKAESLKNNATILAVDITDKLTKLQEMETKFKENHSTLKTLDNQIGTLNEEMKKLLEEIQYWASYHRECQP